MCFPLCAPDYCSARRVSFPSSKRLFHWSALQDLPKLHREAQSPLSRGSGGTKPTGKPCETCTSPLSLTQSAHTCALVSYATTKWALILSMRPGRWCQHQPRTQNMAAQNPSVVMDTSKNATAITKGFLPKVTTVPSACAHLYRTPAE